jgi:hypothetical protein
VRKTKACIFCGRQPTVEDHWLSRDLREALGYGDDAGPAAPQAYLDLNSSIPKEAGSLRPRKTNFAKLRAKVVCRECDDGWLADGQGLVRQLLEGAEVHLGPEEQLAVATWSLKSTMLFEYATGGQELVISPHWRRGLFKTHVPPTPCCYVWIGPSGEHAPRLSVCKTYRWGYLPRPDGDLRPWFGVSNVFSMEALQIVVLACNLTPPDGQLWDDFPDAAGFVTPAGLRQVWPVRPAFDFPTAPGLDNLEPFMLGHCLIGYLGRLGITGGNPSPQGFIGDPAPKYPELPPESEL